MAIYCYVSGADKLAKLLGPYGLLSMIVPSSSITQANVEVRGVLEESVIPTVGDRKQGHYVKLLPELTAQIRNRAAEHRVATTVRFYARGILS